MHGVGQEEETDCLLPSSARAGHTLVLGTTGVGKTRLAELLVTQDIRRGDVVFMFDPKGDADMLLRMYIECLRAGRLDEFYVLHLGYPDQSGRYSPVGRFGRITEVATRVSGQLDGGGNSAAFKQFAWRFVNIIARALDALDIEHLNDNDSPDDETRDILGELEIMARLMITGGEKREIDDYRRADSSMVRDAIKAAAEQCHQTQQQVRPTHVKEALISFSEDGSRPDARRERARVMGEAMAFFCDGLEGQIFDQEAEHWPEVDVTIIDLGLYAKTGYEAQMAAAYISLINRINGIAERDQYSGRDIVTLTDEGHLTASNELLAPYAVKIVKMWRKLRAWFWLATQDLADFPDIARKMLNNAEWWVMLNMTEDELTNLSAFKKLSEAENNLIHSMKSEKHKYKEGVVTGQDGKLMQRFTVVPPALYLELGETDGEAKERRAKLMKMHGIGELDAALMKADEIEQARRNYQGERL